MFFLSLELSFHPASRLRPLIDSRFSFLVASFFLQFFILLFKPNCFQALLDMRIGWVVIKVIWTTFESVLLHKLDLLWLVFSHICRIESIERLLADTLFRSLKLCLWGWCLRVLIISARKRLIEHTHRFCTVETSLLFRLLSNYLLADLCIDCFDFKCCLINIRYNLAWKILNPDISGRNLCVDCAFCEKPLWRLFEPALIGLFLILLVD